MVDYSRNKTLRKPKILLLLHYPPPVHGAAMVGQFLKESSRINDQFECTYINLGTSRSVAEIGTVGFLKWWRYLGVIFKTIIKILTFRPELVYMTPTVAGPGFYKDTVVMFLAKMLGDKAVYHFHNKGVQNRQQFKLDNFLYHRVFKNVKIILLAKPLYADIKKYVPEYQVYYCPNGLPNDNKVYQKKADSTVHLLFLSNLLLSKGIEVLLDALVLLKKQGYAFQCSIIGGEGDWKVTHLQQAISTRELGDFVNYKGKKYGAEKKIAYSTTDIFVFPTYEDCFPLVLLESMQFGLPVISTDEGGIPAMVENNITGYIIPKNNSMELARKIAVLINNPSLRKKMGQRGRLKYENEFSLLHFEKRFITIINKILSE